MGRVIPNKKFEDLIKVFCVYQKYVDPKSRLLLVGEYQGVERYFDALLRLVDELELKDVVFTGHVDTNDLAAYYQVGDVFLSLSEHEGFCAPLLEAFRFGIPVMAFDAGAVPDTMGGAGVLIREKQFEEIAEMAHVLVHDDEVRQRVIDSQDRVIEALDARDEEGLLVGYVEQVSNGVKA